MLRVTQDKGKKENPIKGSVCGYVVPEICRSCDNARLQYGLLGLVHY